MKEYKFTGFFGYFDDRLLRRFLFAVYSELDQTFVQSWETRKRAELYTLKLDSIVTLQWLFQLVFPELQVRVDKAPLKRSLTLQSPIFRGINSWSSNCIWEKERIISTW